MSPHRKVIHKYSELGTLGFLGFFFEHPWIRYPLFILGGLLLGLGWVLGMQIQAERTLSKRSDTAPSDRDLG